MKTTLNRISQWLLVSKFTDKKTGVECAKNEPVSKKETSIVSMFSTPTPFQKGIA